MTQSESANYPFFAWHSRFLALSLLEGNSGAAGGLIFARRRITLETSQAGRLIFWLRGELARGRLVPVFALGIASLQHSSHSQGATFYEIRAKDHAAAGVANCGG